MKYTAILLALLLIACADPVDRHIDALVKGGPNAEQAKLELNLAKGSAIAPLVAAFENKTHPARARADLAQALYRLYLRHADPRIWDALISGLSDPDPRVRAGVVQALGDLRKEAGTGPLVDLLTREADHPTRLAILVALEMMANTGGGLGGQLKTGKFSDEEKARFTTALTRQIGEELPDTLRLRTLEWLEILAEEKAVDARNLMLKADLQGAEALLRSALELVPDSKNINYALGRFYYDNGAPAKGLEILAELGLLVAAHKLPQKPQIDGALDEVAWNGVVPLDDFYQCIDKMRAYPIEGRSEAYVGYRGDTLYVAIKGYEESTAELVAQTTQRDAFSLSRDDCVEIFLDPDHDYQSYFQLLINSLGTLSDLSSSKDFGGFNESSEWNGTFEIATRVEDTFWTVEVAIPAAELGGASITKGAVWGFNLARVRIPAAEYGQWAPTYGSALRPDLFGFLLFD